MKKPRNSIRFHPEPLTVALLDLKNVKNFNPELVGLLINESYGGCAVVVCTDHPLKKEAKLRIQVGQLSPMRATIAWVKTLEENIHKLGIKFSE